MAEPIVIPNEAPEYICADLLQVAALESESDGRFLEEVERQVAAGEMTPGDAERSINEFPDGSRSELFDYCRRNCGIGHCAMKGFGTELVGVEASTLSDADREKLSFFSTVDYVRFTGKLSLGISPF